MTYSLTHSVFPFTLIALLFTAQAAMGQGNARRSPQQQSPEQVAQRLTSAMDQILDLNEERQSKVHDINVEYIKGAREARQSGNTSRAEMQELVQKRQSKLKDVLTEEQFQELKAEQKRQRKRQQQMQQRQRQQMQQRRQQQQPNQQSPGQQPQQQQGQQQQGPPQPR